MGAAMSGLVERFGSIGGRTAWLPIVFLLLALRVAAGHPVHESIAEASFDASRGALEVALRVDAVHFEEMLCRRAGRAVTVEDDDPAIDGLIAGYLEETFRVRRPGGVRAEFRWVGREIETQDLWLYFEMLLPPSRPDAPGVEARVTVMLEAQHEQINTATFAVGKLRSSVVFSTVDAGWKSVDLPMPGPPPAPLRDDRPNVILYIVDDLGWQDISLALHTERTPFNDRYRTPSVERLAAAGMRFTNAYAASPVCTPTRVSIMTGQNPARHRITNWVLHAGRDQSAGHPAVRPPAWNMNGLQATDVTLARLLGDAGYLTIHVGKAHFGALGTSGADPTSLGFEVNVAGHAAGGPGSHYGIHDFSAVKRSGGVSVWDVPHLEKYHGREIHLTEALTLETVRVIEEAVEDGRPFYLNMAHYAVHAPIMADARYVDRYEGLDPREAAYASMVEGVDAGLGAILDAIERLGVAGETIVIFFSDNGGLSAHGRGGEPHVHNAPLRSGKGSAYEGGTRVPLVVSWPGVTAPGSVCGVPVISEDLFPTILEMAAVEIPGAHAETVDGASLDGLLRGDAGPRVDRVLGWHYPHQWGAPGPGIHPFSAIRRGRWKLVYFHAERRFELFDLRDDPGETRDLSAERPELTSDLASVMGAWLRARDAQMSIDKSSGEPVGIPGR
jgi:arylsulfatase A-like enzyme